MYDSWTCLSVERGPGMLSDEVRNLLKAAACDLYIKKWDSMHIEKRCRVRCDQDGVEVSCGGRSVGRALPSTR